jgi:hypothetical protein
MSALCFHLHQGAMSAFGDDSDSDDETPGITGTKQAGGRAGVNYMMMKEAQKNKSAKKVRLRVESFSHTSLIVLSAFLGYLGCSLAHIRPCVRHGVCGENQKPINRAAYSTYC